MTEYHITEESLDEEVFNINYAFRVQPTKQVAYSGHTDSLIVYWIGDDILYCLGDKGSYQVAWLDEVDFTNIELLGDL